MQKHKIIVASDSFKGSLTSAEVNETVRETLNSILPNAIVQTISMSDGGEGLLDCFREIDRWQEQDVTVNDPLMRPIAAKYLYRDSVAIVEMAEAAGLLLLRTKERNPLKTTTYGVGEIIKHALVENKCARIMLGLGGSATNDAGMGAMQALGAKFYNSQGMQMSEGLCGGDLKEVRHIDITKLNQLFKDVKVTAACDVSNPLTGIHGAAYIYAPQKGATEEDVNELDANLVHISKLWHKGLHQDTSNVQGAGAAGGMGGGIKAFLDATLVSGIHMILELKDFKHIIADADLVITGEGRIDNQSFMGKLLSGMLDTAAGLDIPVLALGGQVSVDKKLSNNKLLTLLQVTPPAMPLKEALQPTVAKENIARTIKEYFKI